MVEQDLFPYHIRLLTRRTDKWHITVHAYSSPNNLHKRICPLKQHIGMESVLGLLGIVDTTETFFYDLHFF